VRYESQKDDVKLELESGFPKQWPVAGHVDLCFEKMTACRGKVGVSYKGLDIRSSFSLKSTENTCGIEAFYRLPGIGPVKCAALGFSTATLALGDVNFFLKSCTRTCVLSTIVKVPSSGPADSSITVRGQTTLSFPRIASTLVLGGVTTFAHSAVTDAVFGAKLEHCCSGGKSVISAVLDQSKKLVIGYKGTCPYFPGYTGTVYATFPQLALTKEVLYPNLGFSLTLEKGK
jgi:hypothetical protein